MNREIQSTKDNEKIIADYFADKIKQAMIQRYGNPLFTFEYHGGSAQHIVDTAEEVYK